MSWGDDAHLYWAQRARDAEQAEAWDRMERKRKAGLNVQTLFRDNNAETHVEYSTKSGTVTIDDLLYEKGISLNLEDVEMIVKTIRKAHSEFMKE